MTTTTPEKNAIAKAVASAKAHFGEKYEYYEVWERGADWVTIRAWTVEEEDGENDYMFFTERW